MFWTLGHFARFVRPAFIRVELPGVDDLDGLLASAYKAADDSSLVVVVVNAGAGEQVVALDVPGAEDSCFRAFVTDADRDLEASDTVRVGSSFTIPARSVFTLAGAM